MEELKIPTHVGFILDGNGRWAKEKGLSRSEGHQAGFDNLVNLSKYIFNRGVKVLSVYAFSTENFKRSQMEVDFLMNLFVSSFKKYAETLKENDVKVVFSGRRSEPLPKKVIEVMEEAEEITKECMSGILNICVNYGGHAEIVDAVKNIVNDNIKVEDINEELFNRYLYQDLPPVDLLIRTSGELRISNFLLWQLAYAEFYFPNIYFPAFKETDFEDALLVYNKRDRRFGGIKDETKNN